MTNIDRVFGVWPSAKALADDIGVSDVTVRQWRNRSGAIPPRYWEAIQRAALARGQALSVEMFAPAGVLQVPSDEAPRRVAA